MGVCGSHWGLTNSNNTLTASFFLSAVHAYALCYLIWKARLKTSIIFWLLVTWHLSRHQILILRHSDFKVMFESLNCHIDIEIHFMYLDTYIIVQFIKKHPTRCNNVSNFFYSIFIWSSACFWRHTAHHQEPKTALAAQRAWQRPTTFHVWKPRGYQCSFRLLMMGGVSPETCWASYKYGITKFWFIVAFCCIFLYEIISSVLVVVGALFIS